MNKKYIIYVQYTVIYPEFRFVLFDVLRFNVILSRLRVSLHTRDHNVFM